MTDITEREREIKAAREYLIRNVIKPLWPDCEPSETLEGVCTQVDNIASEILALRAAQAWNPDMGAAPRRAMLSDGMSVYIGFCANGIWYTMPGHWRIKPIAWAPVLPLPNPPEGEG